MRKEIEIIFKTNMETIGYSEKAVEAFRKNDFYWGLHYYQIIINNLIVIVELLYKEASFMENFMQEEMTFINSKLTRALGAHENKDYILLSDLLELEIITFLKKMQSLIIKEGMDAFSEENYYDNMEKILRQNRNLSDKIPDTPPTCKKEGCYQIESTISGEYTLALYDGTHKYYVHSTSSVKKEARELAKEWFEEGKECYYIYGLGLGYHILELMTLDDSICVTIFEGDLQVIKLASMYGCVDKLLENQNVKIIYLSDFSNIGENMVHEKNSVFYVHYPSVRNVKNSQIKNYLEDFFMEYSSTISQGKGMARNFRKNILLKDHYVDELKKEFKEKDLYLVAGGPSLDKNFRLLSKLGKESIIVAAGTVYKKLIKYNIIPNYIIITDSTEFVYNQVENLDKAPVPLIYLSTAYYKVADSYKGKRYMVCQSGYQPSEQYAKEQGYHLYQTGGSVITTALDIGIYLECKRIIFLGLDLAYTNQQTHAEDIDSMVKMDAMESEQVEDIDGRMIKTGRNLQLYRKWIENRIKDLKEILIIDCTEGGARIKGTKISNLGDIISESFGVNKVT